MPEKNIPTIILAAGSSSRMGRSKQLLPIEDEPLLRKTTLAIVNSKIDKVVVVLGSQHEKHKGVIKDLPVEFVVNRNWPNGIGTSIKSGLKFVMERWPNSAGVIISVCDQPFLNPAHLRKLIAEFNSKRRRVIVSGYANTVGTPALFNKTEFENLLKIDDHDGAKKLIQKMGKEIAVVEFPKGEIDLDTPTDYKRLIN